MTDLRKAAEMALEALETLWDILDDIDTASDMAKENDAWYRKRVEALQKKRWDTMITTDGYKLKGGPVEALRQALAQPVDNVYISEKRVHKTEKSIHEPVAWWDPKLGVFDEKHFDQLQPLYTAPPKKEWVGLTDEERRGIREWQEIQKELGPVWAPMMLYLYLAIEAKLKEKNNG